MQEVSLQYAPIVTKPVIHVSQYDVGRQFKFKIYDGVTAYTMPVGTTARVEGIKPDGHGFSYDDCVSVTDNIATVTTKLQMTIVAGSVECELRFSDGSDDIGTLNFTLLVEESPINSDTDISDTEIPAIIELARAQMENAEAWTVGERNGVPVGPTDPTYHNNAKYYSDHAGGVSLDGLTDVDIQSLTNGQYIKYDSTAQKWKNTSDAGKKAYTLAPGVYDAAIPANADLNSYTVAGTYDCLKQVTAETLSNCPTVHAFKLMVDVENNPNVLGQTITLMNDKNSMPWKRWRDSDGVWGDWMQYADSSQIQTLANSLSTETTNRQNADSAIDSVISANGAKNLCPNTATTQTVGSEVTFTVNSDRTVSATTLTTTTSGRNLVLCALTKNEGINTMRGTFKLTGVKPSTVLDSAMMSITFYNRSNDSFNSIQYNKTEDGITFDITDSVYVKNVIVTIGSGQTFSGYEFRPMITLASQPNSDYAHYVPYAKTNRELTEALNGKYYVFMKNDPEAGSDLDDLNVVVWKIGNFAFITGSWAGSKTNAQPIITLPSELRGITSVTNYGNGMAKKDNAWYPSSYIARYTGEITQNLSTSAVQGGSFTFIYKLNHDEIS